MTLEEQLHEDMISAYSRAGKEVGYWGNYYLRSVKKNGGLATARRMLQSGHKGTIQKGLQALIDAGRPDLSLEALVLQPKFVSLFTQDELSEAQSRLKAFPQAAFRKLVTPELNFPDTLPDDKTYTEGATRRVTINAFELDNRARAACISKYGSKCAVCNMTFEAMYGEIGKGFIHVHHKKPLAITRGEYTLDPVKDLAPVCPNCHAMLHTNEPPLSIDELKMKIKEKRG